MKDPQAYNVLRQAAHGALEKIASLNCKNQDLDALAARLEVLTRRRGELAESDPETAINLRMLEPVLWSLGALGDGTVESILARVAGDPL
jgi:hypothetical protein